MERNQSLRSLPELLNLKTRVKSNIRTEKLCIYDLLVNLSASDCGLIIFRRASAPRISMEQATIKATNADCFLADYAILCLSCGFLIIFINYFIKEIIS